MTQAAAANTTQSQENQYSRFSSLESLQQHEGIQLQHYGDYCVARFPVEKPTKSHPYDEVTYQKHPDRSITLVDIQIEVFGDLVVVKTPTKRNRYDKATFLLQPDGTLKSVQKTAWTLSIPVKLNPETEKIVQQWQEWLRWIWNDALDMLKEFDRMHAWDREEKQWVPCCPLTLRLPTDEGMIHFPVLENTYRWYKDDEGQFQCAISIPLATTGKKFRFLCARAIAYEDWGDEKNPRRITWREGAEPLRGLANEDLAKCFSQKTNPEKEWYGQIPQQPVRATLKDLAESYSRWRKSKSKEDGCPQFKSSRRGDTVKSLIFEDASSVRKEFNENGTLRRILIPKLDYWIEIPKEYSRQWGTLPIAAVKLVNDMGWSLQLTTSLKPVKSLKKKDTVATIEIVGKDGVLFRDDKREFTIPIDKIEEREQQIRRVQREIARQLERYKNVEEKPQRWLKYMEGLKRQLRWLHRKQRLSTKARHQKLSVFALRRTGAIKLINKKHQPVPVPEPIVASVENNEYARNGRQQVQDINRAKRRYATGAFVACLTQKAPSLGREVMEIKEEKDES